VALVVGMLAGCANDGRDLAEPEDWQTTTTRPSPPTVAPPSEPGQSGLALTSPDFEPGGQLPVSATCAGANVFPNLTWGDVGTYVDGSVAEIAVALADQTNPEVPVLMWLMAGISPDVTGLQAGVMPPGAFETTDDYGITGYGQPCLDTYDTGTRDLQWQLFVLREPSGLETGHPGNQAWDRVRQVAIERATVLTRITN
jgi:phosphatidylethanolamine-binding protein (PEBP) family uncharacterized protein